jgi:hypothetical protein
LEQVADLKKPILTITQALTALRKQVPKFADLLETKISSNLT